MEEEGEDITLVVGFMQGIWVSEHVYFCSKEYHYISLISELQLTLTL